MRVGAARPVLAALPARAAGAERDAVYDWVTMIARAYLDPAAELGR